MTVRVRDDTVHLDLDAWSAIVAGEDADGLAEVSRVGGITEALAATRAPEALLELDISAPGGAFRHLAWVGRDAVALWIARRDGLGRLAALPPDRLAAALARLVGLGPRRTTDRQVRGVPAEVLDRWFDADAEVRRQALGHLDADRGWRLGVIGAGGRPEDTLVMIGADGPGGLWSLTPAEEDERMRAEPVTPTFAYRAFCGILPALD